VLERRIKQLEEDLFYKIVSIEKSENKINALNKLLNLNEEIVTSITTAENLQKVTQNILNKLKRSMKLDEIAILLYNPDNNTLKHFVSVGLSPEKTRIEFFPGNGISGLVFKEKQKKLIERVGEHKQFKHWGIKTDFYKNKTFLSIPMIDKNLPLGVINVCGNTIPSEYVQNFEVLAKILTPILSLRILKEKQENDFYQLIKKIMDFTEALNPYTYGHSYRVNLYSMLIADRIGLNNYLKQGLNRGSRLHDVGKLAMMDIVRKSEKLTKDEIEILKTHPLIGVEFIKDFDFLKDTIPIIKYHHERVDGKGYPGELSGDEIPLLARIVAVADTFDAITTTRTYRKQYDVDYAINELKKSAGSQLDRIIVNEFVKNKSYLYKESIDIRERVNEELGKTEYVKMPEKQIGLNIPEKLNSSIFRKIFGIS
jgi:HD-GYP domain-containing protein (c-di-GMP phosphodiesterase class II)